MPFIYSLYNSSRLITILWWQYLAFAEIKGNIVKLILCPIFNYYGLFQFSLLHITILAMFEEWLKTIYHSISGAGLLKKMHDLSKVI